MTMMMLCISNLIRFNAQLLMNYCLSFANYKDAYLKSDAQSLLGFIYFEMVNFYYSSN